MKDIKVKVGDLVETCSLMPGVVMKVDGDDIEVRSLEIENDNYGGKAWGSHGLYHCGIVPLTPKQVLIRLTLGKEKLSELWDKHKGNQDAYHQELDKYKI